MTDEEIGRLPAKQQVAHCQRLLDAESKIGAARTEAAFRSRYPQAGSISVRVDVRVYRKRPKGFSGHPSRLVELMLTSPLALKEANRLFVERLQHQYSPYVVPANLMSRPIPASELKKIRSKLGSAGFQLPRGIQTLSAIKLALRAGTIKATSARGYDLKLAFDHDVIAVNGASLAISRHPSGYSRIRVMVDGKRQWIRCDALESLALKGGI